MTEQFFGLTDPGKQRKNNEDTFIAELTANNRFVIACVIDGVGGYSGGEIAAALTRESILRRLDKPSGEIIPMIIDCFKLANEKILQEKQNAKGHDNMACVSTLAIVDIERNQFYFAHVGDTRLYLVRDNSLVKISHDQSFVGFLEDSGRLSEAEAMHHPKRNEINKALGLDMQLGKDEDYIETGQSPFLPGDMLLLCSDGLTDMLDSAKIRAIVTTDDPLKEKCNKLIDAANSNGGKDNITVVLVKNNKTKFQYDSARPALNQKKSSDGIIKSAEVPVMAAKPVIITKTNKALVTVLSLLALVFLAASIWFYLQNQNNIVSQPVQVAAPAKRAKNKQEIKLQQAIDQSTGHILILSDTAYTAPIIISEAIRVNKDSLLIKAKGNIVLQCDSGYKGEALNLSSKCKNIILDSLSLTNFQVGILSFNNVLSLKNTRFINCQAPVQNTFTFTDKKYISGKLPDIIFKADSTPVINK
ncbi:MAG TPA: protein phosphatase 2C domain-containing protein [Mucilaginibacter sp.]